MANSEHKYEEALKMAEDASILNPPWAGNELGRPVLFEIKNFLELKQESRAIELLNQAFQRGFDLEEGRGQNMILDAGFAPCDFLVSIREAAEVFSHYGSVKEAQHLYSYILAHKNQLPADQIARCLKGLNDLKEGIRPDIR
jgi:hypothetical protein